MRRNRLCEKRLRVLFFVKMILSMFLKDPRDYQLYMYPCIETLGSPIGPFLCGLFLEAISSSHLNCSSSINCHCSIFCIRGFVLPESSVLFPAAEECEATTKAWLLNGPAGTNKKVIVTGLYLVYSGIDCCLEVDVNCATEIGSSILSSDSSLKFLEEGAYTPRPGNDHGKRLATGVAL